MIWMHGVQVLFYIRLVLIGCIRQVIFSSCTGQSIWYASVVISTEYPLDLGVLEAIGLPTKHLESPTPNAVH